MRRFYREQAIKLTTLTQQTEEVSIAKKMSESDLKHQKEEQDSHMRDKQRLMEKIKYTSEIETLCCQFVQEQDNLKQVHICSEHI